jgi:putative ABC transport system permease protein
MRESLGLVMLAILVAVPIAYLASDRWMSSFAYHADTGTGAYALAIGLSLALAALTTLFHALRAARQSPMVTLRHE